MDEDHSRGITKHEMKSVLMKGNANWDPMTEHEVNALYKAITNGYGKVTFAKLDGYLSNASVKKAITMFKGAAGKDRHLSNDEFITFMHHEEGCSKGKCKAMWNNIEGSQKGYVTLVQFRDWASDLLKLEVT